MRQCSASPVLTSHTVTCDWARTKLCMFTAMWIRVGIMAGTAPIYPRRPSPTTSPEGINTSCVSSFFLRFSPSLFVRFLFYGLWALARSHREVAGTQDPGVHLGKQQWRRASRPSVLVVAVLGRGWGGGGPHLYAPLPFGAFVVEVDDRRRHPCLWQQMRVIQGSFRGHSGVVRLVFGTSAAASRG